MGKDIRYYVADFETTVYKGQANTLVWAAAIVEFNTEAVQIVASIESFMKYIFYLADANDADLMIYFHNLKFDGAFILSYLLSHPGYTQAYDEKKQNFKAANKLNHHEYTYVISRKGQWYRIIISHHRHTIEIRDSTKLLPFSVKQLGDSFGTKHKKLSMEYEGYREPEGTITEDEKRYIANDVLVVKEALEIMFSEGNDKLTIGSCCLSQFKSLYDKDLYKQLFPNLFEERIPSYRWGKPTVGEFIQQAYHGAWCYLVKGKENKEYQNGCTCDVNSLYPYVMHSASGFKYPVGKPRFWQGSKIPDTALDGNHYYFIWFKTRFYIKEGMLPTIQIKSGLYPPKEWLETSDLYRKGHWFTEYEALDGATKQLIPEFVMTQWDWKLLNEHYNLKDLEILGGCYFQAESGIFDQYIDYYKEIKVHSKGAKRTEAKLFSNNLYGKMAASPDSSFKVASLDQNGILRYNDVERHDKTPGYIPIGAAITSHARYFTITHAQENYYGPDKPGFIYADTDSLHGDLSAEEWKDIHIHPTEYGCWKLEGEWDKAIFVMPKTYIEHVVKSDGKKCAPRYSITAAGMPKECKEYLNRSLLGIKVAKREKAHMDKDVVKFINTPRTIKDFKTGLIIPGALKAMNIPGGVLLSPRNHTMR